MRFVPSAAALLRCSLATLFIATFWQCTTVAWSEETPCICDRLLSPMCSATSGKYVATSANCAAQCSGFPDAVGCMFLRYYSWRRRCSCSMMLPERSGGVCDAETGVMLSKSAECWECQNMTWENATSSCDDLPDGMTPVFPELPPRNCTTPACISEGDVKCNGNRCSGSEPVCSMANGKQVANSECEALQMGHKHTLPCRYLEGRTTEAYFEPDYCLFGENAGAFVGRVAGWTACTAVIHKCVSFERVDAAMVHSMCDASPQCEAEAEALADEWPACAEAIRVGTYQCNVKRAQRIWKEAVSALCEPFGRADYT